MARTPADEYWARKTKANKALTNPKARVTITSESLEREIRKAHAAGMSVGFRQGFERGKRAKIEDDDRKSWWHFFEQFTKGDK